MVKKIFAVIICICVIIGSVCTGASAYEPDSFSINAEGCVFASLDTGEILYEKNADKKLYPASLTKIMTAVVVLDECNDLNSVITASDSAIKILQGTDSSTIGLQAGEQLSVLNLLYILLVHSANDAANVLAEHFGNGSISSFVDKMNAKASELKLTGTHFVNAHGLHNANHYTTPHDMFVLTSYALKNETFKKIVETVRYSVPATNISRGRTLATTNFLQDANSQIPQYFYKYAGGVKTGYTDEAGRCLISTATKNGETYICVLMKSPVTNQSGTKVRLEFGDSKNLYEWAFKNFEYRQVFDTETPVGECPVSLSADSDHVTLVLKKAVNATLPVNADNTTIEVVLNLKNSVAEAPIQKGQVMGTATIKYAGREISTVEVISMSAVTKSPWMYAISLIKSFFNSSTIKIIIGAVIAVIILLILYSIWLNKRKKRRKRRRR